MILPTTTRVFEYDDYPRDAARFLDWMDRLHAVYPKFKACVFAIPKAMSPEHYDEIAKRPWLRLYPHGFRHLKGECRYPEQYRRNLRLLYRLSQDSRWQKVFKAPWHGLSGSFAARLHELGFAFACRALHDFPDAIPADWKMWNIATAEYKAKVAGCYDDGLLVESHPVYGYGSRYKKARKTQISARNMRYWRRHWRRSDTWAFVDELLTPVLAKLNLGCGSCVLDGWMNLDPRASLHPDIIEWDFSKQIPISDCKADVVLTSHVFNYVAEEDYDAAVLDIWRVLRPNGIWRMAEDCTDAGYVWRYPGQRARGTGVIRSLPTKQKLINSLIRVGFAFYEAKPGETMSPHKDVLLGDTRSRRYRCGHKFYLEARKEVHHYGISRVTKCDTRANPFGRYVLPVPKVRWHAVCNDQN